MNIGIDIDDTMTYTYETIIPMIAIKYKKNLDKLLNQKYSYKMIYKIFPNYKEFVVNNYSTLAKIVPLKEGVVETIKALKEAGHKIYIISSRNYLEYKEPYELTYNYLIKNNIPFDKLIVNAPDKAKECMANNIDLFIDNDIKNCRAVSKKGIKVLQFNTMFTPKIRDIESVNSWEDVYHKVQEMYV